MATVENPLAPSEAPLDRCASEAELRKNEGLLFGRGMTAMHVSTPLGRREGGPVGC